MAATPAANDYALTGKLMSAPIGVSAAGASTFDKKNWALEKDNDGSEIYSAKNKPEAKGAILRTASGDVESVTTFKLDKSGEESASSLFFENKAVKSYTQCANDKSVGRVCVTATADLCHALKASALRPDDVKDTDTYEMKALALILTLRGSDHQLDNMAHTGNRLGLKTALQTTKGQLIALAREVAKESGQAVPAPREPAAAAKIAADDKLAQGVLEKSLPRLKQACLDTHFN